MVSCARFERAPCFGRSADRDRVRAAGGDDIGGAIEASDDCVDSRFARLTSLPFEFPSRGVWRTDRSVGVSMWFRCEEELIGQYNLMLAELVPLTDSRVRHDQDDE